MVSLRHTSMCVLALALLLPATAQAGPERTQQDAVVEWMAPTPASNSAGRAGQLPADDPARSPVSRRQRRSCPDSGHPDARRHVHCPGWEPRRSEVHVDTRDLVGRRPQGDVHGRGAGEPVGAAEPRTMTIRVTKAGTPPPPPPPGHPPQTRIWPQTTVLSDYKAKSYKGPSSRAGLVRRGPSRGARLQTLKMMIPEHSRTLSRLCARGISEGQIWVQVASPCC